jgi:hypothetical protein
MEHIHDSHNIIGMGKILADDVDGGDLDLAELNDLEKSVINRMDIKTIKPAKTIDYTKDFTQDIERLNRQLHLQNDDINDTIRNDIPRYEPPKDFSSIKVEEDEEEEVEEDEPTSFAPPETFFPTKEEARQKEIAQVMSKIDHSKEPDTYLQEEDAEDEMARIVEQVDLLRSNLESEGVDLSRIQNITTDSNRKEAKAVLKILQIKNDRMRYCDVFEEMLIAGAYTLESVFDGKNVWFGKQIDLTGWSETVKVKLRRMRYDTSQFISDTVKGYSIGSGWRILLELLPSLFLYSRDRRLRPNDNIAADTKYKDALRDLNK